MMRKVLIVDDNDANLYLLKSMLEDEGIEVTAAKNGQEALDSARAKVPDLIVSDILMPVMDGYLFCRKCKEDERLRQIPFVFYTATYTEPKDEKFALGLGADRFVLKPQEPEILVGVLKEVWEARSPAEPAGPAPLGEEMEFFRQYNEVLFRKLEKKMSDMERANLKLKGLEEQYRLSFENVTDIVWTIDRECIVQKLSPSVERMLGYKAQEFIGRSVTDLMKMLNPESLERAMADISLVLSGQNIPTSVYSLIARDGTIKEGEFSGCSILHEGKIVGMVSVIRDITERMQAEEDIRRSEKKYRELFDFLPIPVYEMDFETNITSANRAIHETFRSTEEDLKKGFNGWQLISPEDVDKFAWNIQRLLKGEQLEGTEYTLRRLDGTVFPAIVISRVMYRDGKPAGLRGAIIDITKLKQSEEELKRANSFLDSIIENIPVALFLKDALELKYVRFNRVVENLLGYSREELLGKNDYDFFPPEQADFFVEKDREVLRGQEVMEIPEESIQTRTRETRVLHTKKVPISNEQGEPKYLLGISEDITERKLADQKLRDTLESLSKAVNTTIHVMVSAVETRDPYTAGHQLRVADIAHAIAGEMDLAQEKIDGIRMAASIHDIGKLSIPAEILVKPKKLTAIEFSLIKEHSRKGYEMLLYVESPWPLAEIVYQHHERMDGSGYPRNLKGNDILIEARIIAVSDVLESMASHRPYRPALGIDSALEGIEWHRGILYDADVVDACLRLFREKRYRLV